MSNTIQLKRKTTTGAPSLGQLAIGEACLVVPDNALYIKKDASTILGPFAPAPSSTPLSTIVDTCSFDFGNENNTVVVTVACGIITDSTNNIFSYIPVETSDTSLDEFALNGVSFNIENIIELTSFDIRATAINNASGIYTINYKIIM